MTDDTPSTNGDAPQHLTRATAVEQRCDAGTDRAGQSTSEGVPDWSRRQFLGASAAAGLGATGLGMSGSAVAEPADEPPSFEEAAEQLSHPDPAEEAVALYRYLHDVWGEQVLSGQQREPWGIDEFEYVEEITGKTPAVYGGDFIHEDKSIPIDDAIEHWENGGIPKLMWHWGVPGQETPEDEYDQSRDTGVEIDLERILEEGTEPYQAFYDEMDEVADQLERAGDAGVPILFGPFHEFEGGWFWWGVEGPEFFVEVWERMHEYFVEERAVDNVVWLLPHSDYPDPAWIPDESTYDLFGADTYDPGTSYEWLYQNVVDVHGEGRPIVMHEIGRDPGAGEGQGQPPDPDDIPDDDVWWSMWVNWHTDWLESIEDDYLDHVYNHELTATLEDVPDVVEEYGDGGEGDGNVCDEAGADDGEQLETGDWVCDVDGDGSYRDVNADGDVTSQDLSEFFANQHRDPWDSRDDLFDFNDDGNVGQPDVVDLFEQL